ncbi:unnamed protein product [Rotaria socialis]|uniref:Uncharacterized protein n=2 Tax=Rotaria socialis TaxID=392032 RepID=A0A821FPP4_9BILA|nr:unnamed protein product [Rotaria socialis]
MNLKSKALDCFKNKHGFMLDDDTFIIKSGIKGNVDYLFDLLKQKCTEDAKLTKTSKRNQSSPPLNRTINTSSTTTESTMAVLSNTAPDHESSSDTAPDHESSSNTILLNSTSSSITTDDHESLE